jgi:hypothetical protein
MTKDEMGGSRGTQGVEEKWIEGSGGEIRRKEQLRRPKGRWEDNIKMGHNEIGMWPGLLGLRVGTVRGLLWTRKRTFGLCKVGGISWLAEQWLASQRGTLPHTVRLGPVRAWVRRIWQREHKMTPRTYCVPLSWRYIGDQRCTAFSNCDAANFRLKASKSRLTNRLHSVR